MAVSFDPTTLGAAQEFFIAPDVSERAFQNALAQFELAREMPQIVGIPRLFDDVPDNYEEWAQQQLNKATNKAREAYKNRQVNVLADQLLTNWQGLGEEVGIGSSGTPQAEIGGRPLSVVANEFARKLVDQGVTDLSQANFEPGALAAWSAEGKGNTSLVSTPDGRLIPVWGSSSDTGKARNIALTVGSMFVAPGLAGALGGGLGGYAGAGAILGGSKAAITGEDILKGALLGGLGGAVGYGLFGGGAPQSTVTDAQFIAADAAQLAAQGIPVPQIEQILQASGVSPAASIGAADAAVAGLSVPKIAQEITVGSRGGLFTQAAPTTPSIPTEVTVSPEGLQTVTTTAAAPVANISDIVAAVPAAVLPQAATPMVDLPPLTPADQTIEITGTAPRQQTIGDVAADVNAGALYGPLMTGAQTAKYDEVLEKTGSKEEADKAASAVGQLTLKDLYTALQALGALSSTGLFGGGGGGGTQQRSFVAPTATVPMGNADYYNAVQQYYNTYMPQTPRDVATPLQQWYEGKFGG